VSIHTEITSTQRREEREEIYQQKFKLLCVLCVENGVYEQTIENRSERLEP
jgi:hypothetical protein